MAANQFMFPFEPYPVQRELMSQIYTTCQEGGIGIFESPTGTGKSLSVICSALKWRADVEQSRKAALQSADMGSDGVATVTESEEPDWLRDWEADKLKERNLSEFEELSAAQERLKSRLKKVDSKKMKMSKPPAVIRSSLSATKEKGDGEDDLVEDYLSDNEEVRRKEELFKDIPEEEDTRPNKKHKCDDEVLITDNEKIKRLIPKVYYASRTHSQLAQFVREVRKTSFKDIKVVTLGSRKTLCVNPDVSHLGEHLINDGCLDLQQKREKQSSKRSNGCPFLSFETKRNIADKFLSKVMDIEECVSLAKAEESCAYYGSREAAELAELVVLPYNSILHKQTRSSLGIELKGNTVILDEAHNIIETINSIHGASLRMCQVTLAEKHLLLYLDRYRTRLKGKNILYINQIVHILKAIGRFFLKSEKMSSSSETKVERTPRKVVLTINDLLFDLGIDNLNFYKIDRYLEQSKLPQKLLGFMQKGETSQTYGHVSHLSLVQRFMMALTNSNKDGRVVYEHIRQDDGTHDHQFKFILLNPSLEFKCLIDEAHAVVLLGGTMQPFDYVAQQLFTKECQLKQLRTFACGHVIPPENILPLALTKGPNGVEFDFTFKSRNNTAQLNELGCLIHNVCVLVPAGVVVFFPSFDYEQRVVTYWKSQGTFSRISSKKRIFREPRSSSDVDTTLGAFSRCVENHGGALLLCVVGAKMSEGINFSDDMARCVIMVGLPYPDISDPELAEKMKYLDSQGHMVGAGKDYYENLCMRAVNQSIGRSIRHIGDYSALVLADKRYVSQKSILRKIPRWISDQVVSVTSFGEAVKNLRTFFALKRKQNESELG